MEKRSQNDIVAEMLQRSNAAGPVTDELYLPGVRSMFVELPRNAKKQTAKLRVTNLQKASTMSRANLVDLLMEVWHCAQSGSLVGFTWNLGDAFITIKYVNGLNQTNYGDEDKAHMFSNRLLTVLKSRKNVVGLTWNFDEDFVTLTCLD